MTAPRARIEASLADRGRPVMWANEQESAVLMGYGADGVDYRAALPGLMKAGFPPVNPRNGRRFIPAILDYLLREIDSPSNPAPESTPANEQALENFPDEQGKRRAS